MCECDRTSPVVDIEEPNCMSEPTADIGRLDSLLMRVLDGEASGDERDELLALADADERLAAHGTRTGQSRTDSGFGER